MKAKYKVHSVGPATKAVEVTLPSGDKAAAEVKYTVVELVAAADHGTVTLAFFSAPPFAVGDSVEATFEKVS